VINRCLCFCLVAVALTACSRPVPPTPQFADLRFTNEPMIALDVVKVQVINRFQPSFTRPEVEYEFTIPPQRAIENWVHDRLHATAASGNAQARFTIEDASVKEVELPRTSGLKGAFTTDQAQRYDGHVAVKLEILNEQGFPERSAVAEASVSRSVPEGVTLNQRDQAWYEISQALSHDIDGALERQIRDSFAPYVH
jgi:hypothetical protein